MPPLQARLLVFSLTEQKIRRLLRAAIFSLLVYDSNGVILPTDSGYQSLRKKEGVSNRSVNFEVCLIRSVLIKHRRWHTISPDVRMLPENEDVGRALSPEEQVAILNCRPEKRKPKP
jgi:hypothetical protein